MDRINILWSYTFRFDCRNFLVYNSRKTRGQTRELLEKIDQTMSAGFQKISELIVADGERTRELLRSFRPTSS